MWLSRTTLFSHVSRLRANDNGVEHSDGFEPQQAPGIADQGPPTLSLGTMPSARLIILSLLASPDLVNTQPIVRDTAKHVSGAGATFPYVLCACSAGNPRSKSLESPRLRTPPLRSCADGLSTTNGYVRLMAREQTTTCTTSMRRQARRTGRRSSSPARFTLQARTRR